MMVDKLDHLHVTGRNVEWYNCSDKFGTFLKYQICTYHITQKSHYCKFIPEGEKTWCSYKDLYVNVHSSFIHNEQNLHNPIVLQEVSDQTVISIPWNAAAAAAAKLLQSCPTLCDPRDSSPPGSPIPGILQARTLGWVAISFSNAWKWKVKVKSLSRVWLLTTPWTVAHQPPPSMGFSRQEYCCGVAIAFSDHEILLSNKKEWSSNTCNSLDESHGNCAAWKKLLSKGTYYMLSLLYNFQNDKIKWLEINQWLPGMMKGKEHGGCGYKW